MIQQHGLEAFTEFHRVSVIVVGVPIMICAGIATYFNSRASVARQSPEAAANPQTAMMNKLALYVFPLGVVVGGPFLPLAIIMYWLANNIWTFGQQHYVFSRIEKEEEQKKQEALERRAANAPAPGAKPSRKKKTPGEPGSAQEITAPSDGVEVTGSDIDAPSSPATDGQNAKPIAQNGAVNRTPKPGARPKKRKR
jgi:YidC/Oxa1 family membrane protein insertase